MTSLFSNKLSLVITQVMSCIRSEVLLKASDHSSSYHRVIGSKLLFNIETAVSELEEYIVPIEIGI